MKKWFAFIFKTLTIAFTVHLIIQEYIGWRYANGIQEIIYLLALYGLIAFGVFEVIRNKSNFTKLIVLLTAAIIQAVLYYYMTPYLLDDPTINWTL